MIRPASIAMHNSLSTTFIVFDHLVQQFIGVKSLEESYKWGSPRHHNSHIVKTQSLGQLKPAKTLWNLQSIPGQRWYVPVYSPENAGACCDSRIHGVVSHWWELLYFTLHKYISLRPRFFEPTSFLYPWICSRKSSPISVDHTAACPILVLHKDATISMHFYSADFLPRIRYKFLSCQVIHDWVRGS
jgi:hypothetical protein